MTDEKGFQQRLDPKGNKLRQFSGIIDSLAVAPRPKTDYRLLSHVDFLGLDFLRRLLEIQTSYMLLFRSFAAMYRRRYIAEPMAKKEYLSLAEILEWSRSAGPRKLYETYCTYPDRALIALFVDLKLEEPFFRDEFVARLADKPFTSELILIDWGGLDRQKELEKLLQVNRIKSFRPEKQSDEEIRQSAWVKTWEEWRRLGSVSDDELTPLPEFPGAPYVKMLPPEKEFWEGPMAKAWHDGKLAFLREGIPALAGDKESIPETVRQHRRHEWKKIARREKIFQGRDHFPEDGPDSWRAYWDFSESAAAQRRAVIHGETTGQTLNPEDVLAGDETRRANLKQTMKLTTRAYEIAAKRSGQKGVVYINELKAGKTEKEAADRANISDRTGRRILEAIREAHPKTHKKTRR
jgi:hypothetical protein